MEDLVHARRLAVAADSENASQLAFAVDEPKRRQCTRNLNHRLLHVAGFNVEIGGAARKLPYLIAKLDIDGHRSNHLLSKAIRIMDYAAQPCQRSQAAAEASTSTDIHRAGLLPSVRKRFDEVRGGGQH